MRLRLAIGVAAVVTSGLRGPTAVAQASDPAVRIEVNLPAYRLDLFVSGDRVRIYPVAIGMPDFRTPRGTFDIRAIEWNPWWIPPRSDWAKAEKVTPPGPGNPMGKVRFPFRRPYVVHGTPERASIGKAASHGCVRLANPDAIELAVLVQRALLGNVVSDTLQRRAARSRQTVNVQLPHGVLLRIRYDLAEVIGDTLFVYPDPYGLGSSPARSAQTALAAAGLDTNSVNFAGLRVLARYPAERTNAYPILR